MSRFSERSHGWGVCLGSQLLAASLGAAVFPSLQWHGDTYELPAGAVRLARSSAYEDQAFVVRRAYGLQFHLEVPLSLATQWASVPAYAQSIEALSGSVTLPSLLEQVAENEHHMTSLARTAFAGWLEHVVGLAPVTLRSSTSGAGSRPS